jgi:outer membrane autotransporter protein
MGHGPKRKIKNARARMKALVVLAPASLLAAGSAHAQFIDYADGENNTTPIDIGVPPPFGSNYQLQVNTGAAEQSGAIFGFAPLGGITKIGAGSLLLSGNNTYIGATTIAQGTLIAGTSSAFGPAAVVNMFGGTTLGYLDGVTISNAIGLNDSTPGATATLDVASGTATQAGAITSPFGNVTVVKSGAGTLVLGAANPFLGAGVRIDAGTLEIGHAQALGSGTTVDPQPLLTLNGGALRAGVTTTLSNNVVFSDGVTSTVSAASGQTLTFGTGLGGAGTFTLGAGSTAIFGSATDTGTVVFRPDTATATATSNLIVAGGTLRSAVGWGALGVITSIAASTEVRSGATLDLNDTSTTIRNLLGDGTVTTGSNGAIFLHLVNATFSGTITGGGNLQQLAGTSVLSGNNTYAGSTFINVGGTLQIGDGGTTGTLGAGAVTNNGTLIINRSNAYTIANTISGNGGFAHNGTGTTTLSAANSYNGATTVNAGTLIVNGSIASSSLTTVNTGATLTGIGTVGATTIAGGSIFTPGSGAPATSMNVNGPLTFDAGSTYRVNLSSVGTSSAAVTGAATLTGGTVEAQVAPGTAAGSYTILSATGGRGGTEFAGLSTSPLTNFTASLSYTPNEALLNLAAALGLGTNLNQNQQNVAGAINGFANGGGALPAGFVTLFGLTGQPLATALTQLSGEHATGIQRATNLSTGLFLNAMLDPFVMGRSGFGAGGAMGYAPEAPAREAYAADMPLKAAPPAAIYEQRWSVWGAGYGGRSRVDGEPVIGSNDLSATAAGFAAGADYRVSSSSVIGAAFAIGETRWNVAGVGKGNADVAQVGGYASTRWNDLYVSGAVAVAWHDASTDRTLNIAGTDQLRADFNATSWGARFEGGYRYGGPALGLTPYAAVQMQSVRTPDYSERATSGSNQFALSYVSESVIDTRTELGFWADTRHALGNGSLLILRGRAAWVHDFNPDSRIQAAFQTLPGASFVVDGAAAPRDAALTSAVAELRMANGVSLIGKFDGEFSGRSNTYAGTGTLRYSW